MRKRAAIFPLPTDLQVFLLRAAVLHAPQAGESWSQWRKAGGDLQRVDPASLRLLPQIYLNLRGSGVEDPAMPLLKGAYQRAWRDNQLVVERGVRALRALERAGIGTLVLKGGAVEPLHYGIAGARPMDDFDIAVRSPDALRAITVLQGAGFQPKEGRLARNVILPLTAYAFSDANGYRIDLHASVLWQPEADEPFWAGAVPLRVRDVETRALCPTDQLIHACVHGARWAWVPAIRWVSDAMMILGSDGCAVDWTRLEAVAARARLCAPLAPTLDYLRREFDAPVPEGVLTTLRGARVSAVERIAHRTHARPPSIWRDCGLLPVFWDRYSALARLRSERPRVAGFLSYLQEFWGLPSRRHAVWHVAFWLRGRLRCRDRRAASPSTSNSASIEVTIFSRSPCSATNYQEREPTSPRA